MPNNNLLRLSSRRTLFNPPNIQSPILPIKAPHPTHIIPVISKLVPGETVFGRVGHGVVRVGEGVAVFAFPAVGTAPTREEEADVFVAGCVGAGEACVAFDVASGLGFGFARGRGGWVSQLNCVGSLYCALGVTVLSVTSSPFVVPDI